MNQNLVKQETQFFFQMLDCGYDAASFKHENNYSFYIENQDQNMNTQTKQTEKEDRNKKIFEENDNNNQIQKGQTNNHEGADKDGSQYIFKSNNLIKNILKHFYKFLTNKENVQIVSEFIIEKPAPYSVKLIKKYFERVNYNNYSLIKIIKHSNYGKGFEYFLTFEAANEILQSKIKNIQEHIDCISYLKECCVNPEQISEINFYKKTKFL